MHGSNTIKLSSEQARECQLFVKNTQECGGDDVPLIMTPNLVSESIATYNPATVLTSKYTRIHSWLFDKNSHFLVDRKSFFAYKAV